MSVIVVFIWAKQGQMSSPELWAMAFFSVICATISWLSEERRRANKRVQQMKENLEDLVDEHTEELRNSEKRSKSIIEQSPLAIVMMTPEGQITDVNPAWMRQWNLEEEEKAEVLTTYNMRTDKQFENLGLAPLVERAFAGESVVLPPIEYNGNRTLDEMGLEGIEARTRWVQCHLYPVKHENGGVTYVIGINADITEQKEAEQERERILTLSQDLICIAGTDGYFTYVNLAWERILGYSEDELLVRPFMDLVHPDDRARAEEELASLAAGRPSFDFEIRSVSKDGTIRNISWMVTPLSGENLLYCIGRDITDRKKSELQVQEMASFAELNPAPVLRVNPEGIILSCNPAALNVLGKNIQKGASICYIFPRLSETDIKKYINDNTILTHEVYAQGKYYLFVLRGVRDLNLLHLYGSDITERKEIEEEAIRLREEHLHIARVVAIGELAASIAHELKQPLAAIRSNAQAAHRFLAGKNPDLDEFHAILTDIIKDNRRADDVIGRLRTLVRKEKVKITKLNINELIQGLFPLVRSYELLRNISLEFKPDDRLPSVSADRVQLQQVMLNLLLNSSEALMDTNENMRNITILTSQKDTHTIRVEIKDNGPGINKQTMDHLFEPFYTTKKEGLGMGLAISRSIIDAHSGSLWAENNSDCGVTFYFTLPVFGESFT
jgi:PAS domain S-box-containing protein